MEKKVGINRTRAGNFKKASDLKRKGYKSAIHALPPEVKAKVDELLNRKNSAQSVLTEVSNKWPKVKLPSIQAINNYRKKYLGSSLADTKAVTKLQVDVDKKVLEIQNAMLLEVHFLVTKTIPKMREGLMTGLEIEKKVKLPTKNNNDRAKAITDMMMMGAKMIQMSGSQIFARKTVEELTGTIEETEERREDYSAKLTRILTRRVYQIGVKRERTEVGVQEHTPA